MGDVCQYVLNVHPARQHEDGNGPEIISCLEHGAGAEEGKYERNIRRADRRKITVGFMMELLYKEINFYYRFFFLPFFQSRKETNLS